MASPVGVASVVASNVETIRLGLACASGAEVTLHEVFKAELKMGVRPYFNG
jgi:hypothetical protein